MSEAVAVLRDLPGIRVGALADRLSIQVPAIGDTVHIKAGQVQRHRRIVSPTGDPAVEFVLGDQRRTWPLIVTPGDVVFQPVDTGVVLDSAMEYRVTDAPGLVAYTEMEHVAEQTARACQQGGMMDLDGLGASLLLVRCQIVAATLLGLRPVLSVAWWQRGWTSLGGDLPLPPFRTDLVWDELARATAR
ncbi:hypothetical protein [Actinoplanes sp. NPDC051851]|uniref:hypothetical protein n=1 Tax=Actinoplanes sp. NPDC051851 TaxID=3154753 RepID=UPI00341B74C1